MDLTIRSQGHVRILLTKRKDGGTVLRCVRDDGTETWQRHEGRRALFFPLHDLAHYAVETTLGFQAGFYGLIASGWDIADTTGGGSRGPLPDEALAVEHLVGLVELDRVGSELDAAALNREAASFAQEAGRKGPRPVSDEEVSGLRERLRTLHREWNALLPGETLELGFGPPGVTGEGEGS